MYPFCSFIFRCRVVAWQIGLALLLLTNASQAVANDLPSTLRLDEAVHRYGRIDLPCGDADAGKLGTGLRLVSHGKIREDGQEVYTVWRIRNASDENKAVVLKAHDNGAEQSLMIPAHTETFVRSRYYDGSATHKLFYEGQQIDVKASNQTDFVDSRTVRHPYTPNNPTDVSVVPASDTEAYLNWLDNSDNETGFHIERRLINGGTFAPIFTTTVNQISFLDTTLVAGATYEYRLQALNGDQTSDYSDTATVTTMLMRPITYYAIASNNWTIPLTWSHTSSGPPTISVPHETALVFINGHAIDINNDQLCTKLQLNADNNPSLLTIEGATLVVRDRVVVEKSCNDCISNIIINNKGRLHCKNL